MLAALCSHTLSRAVWAVAVVLTACSDPTRGVLCVRMVRVGVLCGARAPPCARGGLAAVHTHPRRLSRAVGCCVEEYRSVVSVCRVPVHESPLLCR